MIHKYTNILKKTKMFNNVNKHFTYFISLCILYFKILILHYLTHLQLICNLFASPTFSYSTFIIGFPLNSVLWKIFPKLKSNFVASYHPVLLDLSVHHTILFFHVSSLNFFIHSSLSNTDRRGQRDRMEVGYLPCM